MDQIILAADGYVNHQNRRCYKTLGGDTLGLFYNGINIEPTRSGFVTQLYHTSGDSAFDGTETHIVIPILCFPEGTTDADIINSYTVNGNSTYYLDDKGVIDLAGNAQTARGTISFTSNSIIASSHRALLALIRVGNNPVKLLAYHSNMSKFIVDAGNISEFDYAVPFMTDSTNTANGLRVYGYTLFNSTSEYITNLITEAVPRLEEATQRLGNLVGNSMTSFISR